ncbi:MAG: nitroreductase [Clostridia bacterium]|nr:nitroreductase [Clostridia bacterium]
MNEFLKLIEERRSVKGYLPDMPKKEDIDLVIKAGLEAASGRNMQGAIIVAITDKAERDRLSGANAAILGAKSDPFYGAPCVLVVLANKAIRTSIYDGSLMLGNMMLAAHALGLGSCWIHRARETFELPEWKEWLRSHGIEGEYEGVGNLVLGYRSGDYPAEKPRLPGRVYYI